MDSAEYDSAEEEAPFPVDDALEALRWNWGEAYEIEVFDDEWRARRRDGLGDWITKPTVDELRSEIVSDYLLKPVRRPQEDQ